MYPELPMHFFGSVLDIQTNNAYQTKQGTAREGPGKVIHGQTPPMVQAPTIRYLPKTIITLPHMKTVNHCPTYVRTLSPESFQKLGAPFF